jgi:predicted ribosome quality control (RQC) complex YloA/Tae2 family protein
MGYTCGAMYFDALTTAAVADELRSTLLGGRVQQALLMDELSVGLEIYAQGQRHYLLASAHLQHSRVHLTGQKLRRGPEIAPPLLLMLRKYVRGGRVLDVRQPPFERILRLEVGHPEGNTTLIVEAMGRHANVILVDAVGQVMDAVKRVGPQMSRRVVLPGQPYTPPPPRPGFDPTDLTELRLRTALTEAAEAEAKTPAWRALVRGVQGVSPLLAREVVFRASGDAQTRAARISQVAPLLDAFHDLLVHLWEHRWEPCLAREEGEIVAFAPYPLQQYADHQSVVGISEAVAAYYESQLGADAYTAARRRATEAVEEARKRVQKKRGALERSLAAADRADELRLKGEMTLAYAHTVEPGQTELLAPVDSNGSPLRIALDPKLTAVENAQRFFREYEKTKGAVREVPSLLEQAELELRYLDQLATDLSLATNRPEIAAVEELLSQAGYLRGSKKPARRMSRSGPLAVDSPDGFRILVGRNSRQNDEVTFKRAAPDDLWLHARGVSGGHVVIKNGGQAVPERTLRQAAALAAYYSRDRGEALVAVDYTERRRVRRVKGKRPGLVTYRGERTIRVKPNEM